MVKIFSFEKLIKLFLKKNQLNEAFLASYILLFIYFFRLKNSLGIWYWFFFPCFLSTKHIERSTSYNKKKRKILRICDIKFNSRISYLVQSQCDQ